MPDAVPVLVIGPNDLVTTSVGTALAARGFAVDRQPGEATLPAAPPVGGVALVNLDVPDGTKRVSSAVRAGWSRNEMRRRIRSERAGNSVDETRLAVIPRLRVAVDRLARWRAAAEQSSVDLDEWIIRALDEAAARPG